MLLSGKMISGGLLTLLAAGALGSKGHHGHHDLGVKDLDRACPDGFFYAGEVVATELEDKTRDSLAVKGPASPVYSCYKIIEEELSLSGSILKCQESEGEVASINQDREVEIITSKKFIDQFTKQMSGNFSTSGETPDLLTSGIQLAPESWTWLGADEPIDLDELNLSESTEQMMMNGSSSCITVRWKRGENKTSEVVFSKMPCNQKFNATLCEVRVYTQTWYVWFYTNWLQILFFVTMGLLLLTSCCLFQALFFRSGGGQRRISTVQTVANQPPPYTPTPQPYYQASRAEMYKQKLNDIRDKVMPNKSKAEDKVKFAEAEA